MRGRAASSWYGIVTGQGVLVCNPPGGPIDGRITPGFECLAASVPVAVWVQCRELAGTGRSTLGCFTSFLLPPPLYARIERHLRATRRLMRIAAVTPHLAERAAHEAVDFAMHLVTSV